MIGNRTSTGSILRITRRSLWKHCRRSRFSNLRVLPVKSFNPAFFHLRRTAGKIRPWCELIIHTERSRRSSRYSGRNERSEHSSHSSPLLTTLVESVTWSWEERTASRQLPPLKSVTLYFLLSARLTVTRRASVEMWWKKQVHVQRSKHLSGKSRFILVSFGVFFL